MTLVTEQRLQNLIAPPKGSSVLEASGVVAKDGDYYVIFDNVRRMARVDAGLVAGSRAHGWFGQRRGGDGYEDIAYSPQTRRFYLLIEAEDCAGCHRARSCWCRTCRRVITRSVAASGTNPSTCSGHRPSGTGVTDGSHP